MANLYLIDKPNGESALALAALDGDAKVVLIQDGVYLDSGDANAHGAKVYAIAKDVEKRGLKARIPGFVEVIDYGQLVDLIVDNKVINFC
ncbi:MAG: DsrH/TusB family sulfur metabolism protein [Dehalococcoidia bacterium]|nr:DsrH/TusB family sulfur metabolism protein [Dehalococcoidia bacterium]